MLNPSYAVIIGTYNCPAHCKGCCFECSPQRKEKLTLEQLKIVIDSVAQFRNINRIVWTGGEIFTLGSDLIEAITYANSSYGIFSKCITNGYWATDYVHTKDILKKLQKGGLLEIGFSIGDHHQTFIKIENLTRIVNVSLELGIRIIITLETFDGAKFTYRDLKNWLKQVSPDIKKNDSIRTVSVPWLSLTEESTTENRLDELDNPTCGCDSIFSNLVINPEQKLLSCCGLNVERIPALKGTMISKENILQLYQNQFSDFTKLWLSVSGPIGIIKQVSLWNKDIRIPYFEDPCQACKYLFSNQLIMDEISRKQSLIKESILKQFSKNHLIST